MMYSILKNCRYLFLLFSWVYFLYPGNCRAFEHDIRGQVSGWMSGNQGKALINQAGIRYIPDIFIENTINDNLVVDAEISLNTYVNGNFKDWENPDIESDFKSYRAWGRIATNQFEARIGLQKINFGSAMLFRPLMWFDSIDPRDPLKLTNGVQGLLLRYNFQNNANIWLWGLYDNNDLKGWETAPTKDNGTEFGGRFQAPVFTGEAGITYHHRKADFSKISSLSSSLNKNIVGENRFGFDCKFDVKIGMWLEGTVIQRDTNIQYMKYQRMWTIGADYTFGMGNGLYVLSEFFNSENSDEIFRSGDGIQFSGSSVNYPIGIFDQVSGIHYYDWKNHDNYMLLNWQRIYDNWILHLIGFFNPKTVRLNQTKTSSNAFSGNGFQIMVVFNH
ncbi:hypothetical protein ACFL6H_00080 [Candidatus Latescibacterota bacterium]